MTTEPSTLLGFSQSLLSAALSDCGNSTPHDVSLLFDTEGADHSVAALANAAAFSLGAGLGLNTTTNPGDVMNSTAQDQMTQFIDSCSPVGEATCEVPDHGCPGGTQNSFRAAVASLE